MDDFKKRFLLKKTESKKERNKNGNEYKQYQKYFPENENNDFYASRPVFHFLMI